MCGPPEHLARCCVGGRLPRFVAGYQAGYPNSSAGQGLTWALTYALVSNTRSVVNLIRSGFEIYTPDYKYVDGEDVMYFRKALLQ